MEKCFKEHLLKTSTKGIWTIQVMFCFVFLAYWFCIFLFRFLPFMSVFWEYIPYAHSNCCFNFCPDTKCWQPPCFYPLTFWVLNGMKIRSWWNEANVRRQLSISLDRVSLSPSLHYLQRHPYVSVSDFTLFEFLKSVFAFVSQQLLTGLFTLLIAHIDLFPSFSLVFCLETNYFCFPKV